MLVENIETCIECNKVVYLEGTPTYDVDDETGDKYCDDCGVLNKSIREQYDIELRKVIPQYTKKMKIA